MKAIYESLECKKKDLENRILILDGFDEIKALDIRDNVLGEFVSELKDFENLKCIITSRPAYIDAYYFQNIIEIKEFDLERVDKFYQKIRGIVLDKKEKIESNLEVLGIPVILYMAIMSDIDISENSTKPELYNCIFAEKGGIFDKFFDGETQYGIGEQILRKPENIKIYLDFLSDTAFKMFEKGELQLERNECKDIKLEYKEKEVSVLEFPIKHLFENTEVNIEFVHKSIYEYFVSEYIFWSIFDAVYADMFIGELAGIFCNLFKKRDLDKEILEFLEYKLKNSKLNDRYDLINKVFNLMLKDGMTYYSNKVYKNVLRCEMHVFSNMFEFLHLWKDRYYNLYDLNDYIKYSKWTRLNLRKLDLNTKNLTEVNLSNVNLYRARMKYVSLMSANLKKSNLKKADLLAANLTEADLRMANLQGANLKKADLIGTDLSNANLKRANLKKVNLDGANLRGADLTETDLTGANLQGAIFGEEQISYLKKKCNLCGTRVYIAKTDEIISYERYCRENSLD